jgi:hypothetical protein
MSAAEAQAVAALLDDRAARVEASADVLAARFATATWAGPAADRFRAVVIQRRNEMRDGADALRAAAHAVRVSAGSP